MNRMTTFPMAPEILAAKWFNTPTPVLLADLRGKVVVIEAFQMLCPGCVSHGLPQAQQIHDLFDEEGVVVIGLHSVFEHHAAMTHVSLAAFIHEYRLTFPIAIDDAGSGDIPKTMAAYQLRGTPSLLLVDRKGQLRANYFGQISDMRVASQIAALLHEGASPEGGKSPGSTSFDGTENGCNVL